MTWSAVTSGDEKIFHYATGSASMTLAAPFLSIRGNCIDEDEICIVK